MADTDRNEVPPAPFVPEADIVPPRAPQVVPEPSFEVPPAQLDLGQEEVRLPWLEGDDEFEEERAGGGMGQGVVLALLGLVALAVLAGGALWLTMGKDEELVADGGVISAPKEPYKVRPENPGGEVVAGTGDTSFAVAEGERRQTRIGGAASGGQAPAPGFSSIDPAKPGAAPAAAVRPSATPSEAPVSGVGVQVGAYASKEQAEAGWITLKSQYPALGEVHHRVLQGQADIGTVYRLQAVPGDAAAARALCSGMKTAGLSCQVKG